jgi:hypothetical protein
MFATQPYIGVPRSHAIKHLMATYAGSRRFGVFHPPPLQDPASKCSNTVLFTYYATPTLTYSLLISVDMQSNDRLVPLVFSLFTSLVVIIVAAHATSLGDRD